MDVGDSASKSMEVGSPKKQILDLIVNEVRSKLGLTLFGIDVIIEKGSGRYAIIDMNVFPGKLIKCTQQPLTFFLPGYDGVPNFLEDLSDLIIDEIKHKGEKGRHSEMTTNAREKANDAKDANKLRSQNDDSGIDTSDSCDEKKPPNSVSKSKEDRITRMKHVRGSVNNV